MRGHQHIGTKKRDEMEEGGLLSQQNKLYYKLVIYEKGNKVGKKHE